MSKPPIHPDQSVAGIALDPRTLERVIPESKRSDGSLRKQIKIRPGFTPQEDVSRFRGTKQQQMDRTALPRGHILGWIAPSSEARAKTAGSGSTGGSSSAGSGSGADKPATKSAAKNAKRKAKKLAEKEKIIRDNWEDDEDEGEGEQATGTPAKEESSEDASGELKVKGVEGKTSDQSEGSQKGKPDTHVKDATEGIEKLQIG